jgi:hypothetical protein
MKSELDRNTMSLSMAMFRQRLILAGITPNLVDDEIAKITNETDRALAQNSWEYETTVRRNSELLTTLAPKFSLTPEQLDDLFQ